MLPPKWSVSRQAQSPPDHVLQFADISWPGEGLEKLDRGTGNNTLRANEVSNQWRNILRTLPEWGKSELETTQPIVKVGTKLP